MPFATSPLRLWKSLPRPEREQAARAFWSRPPREVAPLAVGEIVKLLRVRPQAFAKIPVESRVRALAGLATPPDALAEALVVSLHLEARRALLVDFLDALGVGHEEGLIAEDAEVAPPAETKVREIAPALVAKHGADAVRVYWNALWLQDPERWHALDVVAAGL